MLKKILTIAFLVVGVFWSLYLLNSSVTEPEAKPIPALPNLPMAPSIRGTQSTTLDTTRPIIASSTLADAKLPATERAQLLMAIPAVLEDLQISELVGFINAPNPYASKNRDPHSFESYLFLKEAGLRVYALRVLSEKLSTSSFVNVVAEIESNSADESIKRVARQALDFKVRDKNYFEEMKQAIQSTPLPEKAH